MAGVEAQRRQGRPLPPARGGLPGPPPHQPKSAARFEPVDREKTCPLLLRVFTKIGGHHTDADFAVRGKEPKNEVQIYTWKDATLRELTDLVKEVAPEARRRDAVLSFAFVYPDKHGRFVVKEVSLSLSLSWWEEPILIQMVDDLTAVPRHWLTLASRLEITWMWQFCREAVLHVQYSVFGILFSVLMISWLYSQSFCSSCYWILIELKPEYLLIC